MLKAANTTSLMCQIPKFFYGDKMLKNLPTSLAFLSSHAPKPPPPHVLLPALLTSRGHGGKMLVTTAAHSLLCFLGNLWVSPTKLSFYQRKFLLFPSLSSSHLFCPPAFPFTVRKPLWVSLGIGFPASLSCGFWIPTLTDGTYL